MSTRDFFKNSVLEAFGQVDPAKIGLSLLVALAMGILIYCVYKRFFTGVVYSRSFAVTLVGMCVLTCMVTLAISTNVVISLGMVGALSIVRRSRTRSTCCIYFGPLPRALRRAPACMRLWGSRRWSSW